MSRNGAVAHEQRKPFVTTSAADSTVTWAASPSRAQKRTQTQDWEVVVTRGGSPTYYTIRSMRFPSGWLMCAT